MTNAMTNAMNIKSGPVPNMRGYPDATRKLITQDASRLTMTAPSMPSMKLFLDTDDLARDYEQVSVDRQFKFGRKLVARLRVATGDHVLDVGCGTGLLAQHVAGIVGAKGRTVGIDPLPLRIALAQQKVAPHLSFEVGDAKDLGKFAPDSFDVVYLNAVFHWLPEKRGPLRQALRVLKRSGRLGITTRSKDHPSQLHEIKARVLRQPRFARYSEGSDGEPAWVSTNELADMLDETGFIVEAIDLNTNHHFHASAEAAIRFLNASAFGNYLGHLPEELRQCAHDEISAELEHLRTPEGIRLDGAGLRAIAVKP